jgi:hypothetical protein
MSLVSSYAKLLACANAKMGASRREKASVAVKNLRRIAEVYTEKDLVMA